MRITRIIHRRDPFEASEAADAAGRRAARRAPARTEFFAAREVLDKTGAFPFGEGFLYEAEPRARDAGWANGQGTPGAITKAGHHGTKPQQQDSFGGVRFSAGGQEVGVAVVADGVSASGELAKPASMTAVRVFLERLQGELKNLPSNERERHGFVEEAIKHASFAANFEVVRQVLLDEKGREGFDARDAAAVKKDHGITVPTGPLTLAEMQRLAPRLDEVVAYKDAEEDKAALTTFAAAIAVGNDLYTFSCGDAVVGLYRPGRDDGKRFVHLTHRDQQVVELFGEGGQAWRGSDVYENVITDSFGGSSVLSGTLRRYPNLLEPGDQVVAASDGLGPRGGGEGADRDDVEDALAGGGTARALVEKQLERLSRGEYQDNIGVVVLNVD